MARIKLNLNANSKPMSDEDYLKVNDLSMSSGGNGIEVTPSSDEFPLPWDADCWIEGSNFVMEGGAGAGGFGFCRTEMPLNKLTHVLDIEVYTGDAQTEADLREVFSKYGWL